ncbi:MAG: hypothetical protein K2I81_03695 [Alphaproteobacteria bacterium]|nr:hypothetical protein [Alphaproteobacteria bacterium]
MAENKIVWLEDALAAAKTDEERKQILEDYEAQKVAEAQRKEEERLNSPTMIDKFFNGIKSLKKKMQKARSKNNTMVPPQQTR